MMKIDKGAVAVIFISKRSGADAEGYAQAAAEMEAEVARAEGYIGDDSVGSPDGRGITISYWRDEASALAWRAHARHSEVRSQGRATWYDQYRVIVAEVGRVYDWMK